MKDISAHPSFRYMAGMATADGARIISTWSDPNSDHEQSVSFAYPSGGEVLFCRAVTFRRDHPVLDLSDAATVGCLCAMTGDAESGELVSERAAAVLQ